MKKIKNVDNQYLIKYQESGEVSGNYNVTLPEVEVVGKKRRRFDVPLDIMGHVGSLFVGKKYDSLENKYVDAPLDQGMQVASDAALNIGMPFGKDVLNFLYKTGSGGISKLLNNRLKPEINWFKFRSKTPEGFQNRLFDSNIQLGEFKGVGHLSEKGYNYRTLGNEEIKEIQRTGGVFPKKGKAKGGNKNVKYWTKGNEKNWYAENNDQQVIRVKQDKFSNDKVVNSKYVEVFNHFTKKFEPIHSYKINDNSMFLKKHGGEVSKYQSGSTILGTTFPKPTSSDTTALQNNSMRLANAASKSESGFLGYDKSWESNSFRITNPKQHEINYEYVQEFLNPIEINDYQMYLPTPYGPQLWDKRIAPSHRLNHNQDDPNLKNPETPIGMNYYNFKKQLGGFVEGDEVELSEADYKKLIKMGYEIEEI